MPKKDGWILGLSASHNGSACLSNNFGTVVAIQEERLCRTKQAWLYASRSCLAVPYCLSVARISPSDVDLIVYNGLIPAEERGTIKRGASENLAPVNDIFLNPDLKPHSNCIECVAIGHHFAHAVSALATSGLQNSAILVVDGSGSPIIDWSPAEKDVVVGKPVGVHEAISIYRSEGPNIRPIEKHCLDGEAWLTLPKNPSMPRFHSLGGMYAALAYLIFGSVGDAGKVMGLAPYGKPRWPVNSFLCWENGLFRFKDDIVRKFSRAIRWTDDFQICADLAASGQQALEEALLLLARRAKALSGSKNLCLAGGVFLNCVANERIVRECGFEDVHIAPFADDAGVAVGCNHYGRLLRGSLLPSSRIRSDSFGKVYGTAEISRSIKKLPVFRVKKTRDIIDMAARAIASGKFIGWFQGGSELGPRALGYRSILCDARLPTAKDFLNQEIKFRENFRPFAPVILAERATDYFDLFHPSDSPFMLRVSRVKPAKRHQIPAVVHVDDTARIQTVMEEDNPLLYRLISRVDELTGVPIVLNTSFNTMHQPIVETPEDALWCLLMTSLDACVLGESFVEKGEGYHTFLNLVPVAAVDNQSFRSRISDHQNHLIPIFDEFDGAATGRQIQLRLARKGRPISDDEIRNAFAQLYCLKALYFSSKDMSVT